MLSKMKRKFKDFYFHIAIAVEGKSLSEQHPCMISPIQHQKFITIKEVDLFYVKYSMCVKL